LTTNPGDWGFRAAAPLAMNRPVITAAIATMHEQSGPSLRLRQRAANL
jgi:hypothetical protein